MAKAKPAKKTRKTDSDIEKAAKLAAEEVVEEMEQRELEANSPDEADMNFADTTFADESDEDVSERDIFVDAWKKAQTRNDSARFYIYKNSQFTTIKDYPYNWEKLQAEFGEGHYRIVAKSRKNGQNIMVQSELVGDPRPLDHQHDVEDAEVPHNQPLDPFAMITMMSQLQDKSESKAQAQANTQATMMSTLMQTMMQMQSQSSAQFQLLLTQSQQQAQAASQKSQDLVTTLLTTMLSKKDDGGFNAATVLKMIQDAEHKAESRTKDWYKLVDDKAEKLAEEKAELMSAGNDEKEESFTKTLVKGFVPVLTQLMQQQGQPQAQIAVPQGPTPEQIREIQARQRAKALEQQVEKERAERIIAKARQIEKTTVPGNFIETPPGPLNGNGVVAAPVEPKLPVTQPDIAKEAKVVSRGEDMKEKIFDLVKGDIGQALLLRKGASKTAEAVLKKLETQGFARQTIAETFTLEDFFWLASTNGVPEMAKPWLTEFYEHIQKEKKPGSTGRARTPARQLTQNL